MLHFLLHVLYLSSSLFLFYLCALSVFIAHLVFIRLCSYLADQEHRSI